MRLPLRRTAELPEHEGMWTEQAPWAALEGSRVQQPSPDSILALDPSHCRSKRMTPEDQAERILRAVRGRARTLVPGLANRTMALAGHAVPRVTERAMKRAILDRLGD